MTSLHPINYRKANNKKTQIPFDLRVNLFDTKGITKTPSICLLVCLFFKGKKIFYCIFLMENKTTLE
jgi:hypothetical protein